MVTHVKHLAAIWCVLHCAQGSLCLGIIAQLFQAPAFPETGAIFQPQANRSPLRFVIWSLSW